MVKLIATCVMLLFTFFNAQTAKAEPVSLVVLGSSQAFYSGIFQQIYGFLQALQHVVLY